MTDSDSLDTIKAKLEAVPEDWQPIDIHPATFGQRSFLADPDNDRIQARYYMRPDDGALVGRVWFGPGAEGPPGHAHGGSAAAVLDEIMGTACWIQNHPVVAASITTNFRQMLPLHTVTHVEARITGVDGRKLSTVGRIFDGQTEGDGRDYTDGHGLFIEIDPSRFDGEDAG